MNYNLKPVAKVVLPLGLDKEFDYALNDKLNLQKGMRVLVNFAGRKRIGIIVDIAPQTHPYKIKPIIKSLENFPIFTTKHLTFANTLKQMYPYPLGDFLFMMLPPYLRNFKGLALDNNFSINIKNNIINKPVFIQDNLFSKRYIFWKDKVKESLKDGSVIICFPQITYLNEAIKIIEKDFSKEINIIHSKINPKKNFYLWQKTRKNSLIIGMRSSLFYFPIDLKLIIIEEENNHYYFQEEKPFYNLVDVAYVLKDVIPSELILSGDYPRIITYEKINKGEIIFSSNQSQNTNIKVVELTTIKGKKKIISPLLIELIRKNSEAKKKILIIWNKKGSGYSLKCSSCSYTLICNRCSKFIHFLSKENIGVCPCCGQKQDIPELCPKCKQGYIKNFGLGIEKMEKLLKQMFPELNITQWEKMTNETQIILATNKILGSLYSKERFDIGFLLDTDNHLSKLDYNAGLETFFYIKNIALLIKELLYVFTNNDQNYLFPLLQNNWQDLYNYELNLRKEIKLPPFGKIVNITLRLKDEKRLLFKIENLYNILSNFNLEVYGPFKENPFRLRGNFRYFLVIKGENNNKIIEVINKEISKIKKSGIKVAIVVRAD